VGGQSDAPDALHPGMTRNSLHRRLGGLQGLSRDGCRKSRPPPEFDSRPDQPVASRYTDFAILPLQWETECQYDPFSDYPSQLQMPKPYLSTSASLKQEFTKHAPHFHKTRLKLYAFSTKEHVHVGVSTPESNGVQRR
jgi:hypothetical protein